MATISPVISARGPNLPEWRDALAFGQSGPLPIVATGGPFKPSKYLPRDPVTVHVGMTKKSNFPEGKLSFLSSLSRDEEGEIEWESKTVSASADSLYSSSASVSLMVRAHWDRWGSGVYPPSFFAVFSGTWGEEFLDTPQCWVVMSRSHDLEFDHRTYSKSTFHPKTFSFVYDSHDLEEPLYINTAAPWPFSSQQGRSFRTLYPFVEERDGIRWWKTGKLNNVLQSDSWSVSKVRLKIPWGSSLRIGALQIAWGGAFGGTSIKIDAQIPELCPWWYWDKGTWQMNFAEWAPGVQFNTAEECWSAWDKRLDKAEFSVDASQLPRLVELLNEKRASWGYLPVTLEEVSQWAPEKIVSTAAWFGVKFSGLNYVIPGEFRINGVHRTLFSEEEMIGPMAYEGNDLTLIIERPSTSRYLVAGRDVGWFAPFMETTYYYPVLPYLENKFSPHMAIFELGGHNYGVNMHIPEESLPVGATYPPQAKMFLEGTTYGRDRDWDHDPAVEKMIWVGPVKAADFDELRAEAESAHEEKLR
ncbi:hypothetical protein L2W58_08025 [Dethiosulfovibrio sp. F2B]|uniref:hypothetical protein n=1 Tax=Dethiosulfovibrio faecalis TaxID=2720018 RepID=UPI001F28BC5A|nr:hypothetical protein [Dethiosulfovibrio faecalis]MCF4151748.1 hypothetical protein [Dethiosulfovibrio faecalis]